MAYVFRRYRCEFGHEWKDLCERGAPPPAACPTCEAIVADAAVPAARSDKVAAPAIRGSMTKALQNFEEVAFKRPHFDDGSPMLTNLRDNTREGEIAAMPETPQNNQIARIVHEDRQRAAQMPSPWGWQPVDGVGGLVGGTSAGDRSAVTKLAGKQP